MAKIQQKLRKSQQNMTKTQQKLRKSQQNMVKTQQHLIKTQQKSLKLGKPSKLAKSENLTSQKQLA